MGRIRRYFCSARNCKSVYSLAEGGVPMLTFPKDLRRCRMWVQNSGNAELLKQPKNKLYKLRFLCKLHFANDQFLNKYKTRLAKLAVPTIFSAPPLSDKLMEQFEVTSDDDEEKVPFDLMFRSVTRHIDIPTPNPMSHVVIEVSDLPGRVSCVTPASFPALAARVLCEAEAEADVKTEAVSGAASPPVVMDHTYATSGSLSDDMEFHMLPQGFTEEAAAPPTSSSAAQHSTWLQEVATHDTSSSPIDGELYQELIKMERKVQDLQQEVDLLRKVSKSHVSESQQGALPQPDLDLVHLVNFRNRRRKVGDNASELDDGLVALAIFRC